MKRGRDLSTISPGHLSYVLDNSVVSALHQARALSRVLALWPGRWLVPVEVRDEAAHWEAERELILQTLDDLRSRRVMDYIEIDPHSEGTLSARLGRTLGQGESAAIAVAHQRRLGVALDDHAARRACDRLNPPVTWIATEAPGAVGASYSQAVGELRSANDLLAGRDGNSLGSFGRKA